MSADSQAFRITTGFACLASIVVIAITLTLLRLTVKQSEEHALNHARQVILQANGAKPDWQQLEHRFAFNRLSVFDLEANRPVITYKRELTPSDPIQWLENQLIPPVEKQVIHGYEVALQLNHHNQISILLKATGWSLLMILTCGIAAAFVSSGSVKKQLNRDIDKVASAIRRLAQKERGIKLGEGASPRFQVLNQAIETTETSLLTELHDAHVHAETLERHAFYDPLTSLANRTKFKQEMQPKLEVSPTTHFGLLAIVRGTSLAKINASSGYNAGDEYIRQLTEVLTNTAAHFQQPALYRMNSSDLAIVLDFAKKKEYEKLGIQLENQFNDLARQLNLDEVANIGITLYQSGDDVSELLCRCDNALSVAATRSGNSWHFSDTPIDGPLQGRFKWRAMISEIIENSKVVLFGQPQMALNDSSPVYTELQARFYNEKGEQVSTTGILAEAQSNDLLIRLDKTIIERALELIRTSVGFNQNYAINLSNSSILDAHFCIWLERHLLRDPAITRRLVFEVSEHGLTADVSAGHRIIDIIHRVGARFTIEHFGSSLLSLKYFRELSPDYVKLDASHTHQIVSDKKLQYFIRTLVDITHQMGVKVVAESVETVEQKQLFENLNIDVLQGYFVGKPSPVKSQKSDDAELDTEL